MQASDKVQVADRISSRQSSLQGTESPDNGLRSPALSNGKDREDPIANELQDITALRLDRPDNHLKIPAKMVQQLIRRQLLGESGVASQVRQQHGCLDLDPIAPPDSTRHNACGWTIAKVRSKKAVRQAAHCGRLQRCGKKGAQLLNECYLLRAEALDPISREGGSLDRAIPYAMGMAK
jgi:hypothetical protein